MNQPDARSFYPTINEQADAAYCAEHARMLLDESKLLALNRWADYERRSYLMQATYWQTQSAMAYADARRNYALAMGWDDES